MNYTIIEPCCAERQVSQLLASEHKGRAVLMQTSGDITLGKWMQAILLLASNSGPRTMTLSIGEGLTEKATKVLAKYLRLEWIAKLRLMTPTPLTVIDLDRLANACECETSALLERIELAAEHQSPQPGYTDDVLMMEGELGTAIIQGRMTGRPTNTFTLCTGLYGKPESLAVRQFTDPFNAHFKARRYK